MLIVGAGMAGLLAGHMLRRHSPTIIEQQPSLPNNHAALLRFRTLKVAEATGIPFREVRVQKALVHDGSVTTDVTLRESNAYSLKVTGEVMNRSILDLTPATRYIAPPDFIAQMSTGLNIQYNSPYEFQRGGDPVISTIPMPVLMKMVGWNPLPEFRWRPIWTMKIVITNPVVNIYQTIYYSGDTLYYRASFTGNILSIEFAQDPSEINYGFGDSILEDFGILGYETEKTCNVKRQEYGKLLPIDEAERRAFILAMTDKYNIWSLGRFATWRQILLDDVVGDIRFIDRVISEKDQYHRRLHHHSS